MITKLYRRHIPQSLRNKIYDLFLGQLLTNFRYFPIWFKGIHIYMYSKFYPKNEYYDAYRFIGKNGVTFFPFKTTVKYKMSNINVFYTNDYKGNKILYVFHNGNKLFFPQQMSEQDVRILYKNLSTEQDPWSAHRYVKSYDELKGKILLDMGAAEGLFTLDAIAYVEKAYLFDCDEVWLEPLQMTFEPWKKKITFVQKYVSDNNNENCIMLDSFMSGKEQDNLFMKMDIEGAELQALQGAKNLLSNGDSIMLSVCTYHKEDDAENIRSFLESLGYTCEYTPGFLFTTPNMRKAICRAKK